MNKYKNGILALSLLLTTTLVGCSSSVSSSIKYNEFKASEIIENLDKMIFEGKEGVDKYDIYKYAKENIAKMPNIEMSSNIVNSFVYFIYQNIDYYSNLVMALQEEIKSLESVLKIEQIDNSSINKIPEEYKIIKSLLEELDSNYLKLIKQSDFYTIEVDMVKISKEFAEFMNNDTKKYLDFRIKESNLDAYNMNSDSYDVKVILELINDIYINLDNMEGVTQLENWVEHLKYYFDVIFSVSQSTFIDENYTISSDVIKDFEKYITSYEDTKFYNILKGYIKILSENDYNTKSEEVTKYLETVYDSLNSFLVVEE